MKTLVEFINEKQADFPFATGEFSRFLNDIGIAAKIVNREISKAGLADIMGYERSTNVQGEDQKRPNISWDIIRTILNPDPNILLTTCKPWIQPRY